MKEWVTLDTTYKTVQKTRFSEFFIVSKYLCETGDHLCDTVLHSVLNIVAEVDISCRTHF
jgi:hypothetical protein